MSSRSLVGAKMLVKVSIGSCTILRENIDELGYVRVAFDAFYVESQCSGLACRTAEARGDSTGAVLGQGYAAHHLRVVSAIRMWLGNEFEFRRPSLGKYSWTFVSTVPVAVLFVTVPWLEVPSSLGVFASRSRVVGVSLLMVLTILYGTA